MNTQSILERRKRNLADLLNSKILAKGTVKLADGSIRIVTVYNLSTRYEFYIIHKTTAKTKRAPRKTWTKLQEFARDFQTDYKPYEDFASFVLWYAGRNQAQVLSVRLYQKRRLATVQKHTDHESLTNDWHAAPQVVTPGDVKYVNRKFQSKLKGRIIDLSWGK